MWFNVWQLTNWYWQNNYTYGVPIVSGTGLSIYLTDRMGRKKLLLLSGFGMAAAMALLV